MPVEQRIAIVLLSGLSGYLNELVLGVADFARTQQRWQIFGIFDRKPRLPRKVQADGAIVFREHFGLLDGNVPCVHVGARPDEPYPPASVRSNNHRIGEVAAEHLLECGLRTFTSVGDAQKLVFSSHRQEGFRRRVEAAGGRYIKGRDVPAVRFDESQSITRLAKWIATLPKPIGLMGINDVVARQVADACRLADCQVPEQVAIVGVDNEELMCLLSDPPLSSVDPAAKQVGYQAAAMLAQIMDGQSPPSEPVMVPPAGVIVRQSSDVLAVDDQEVAEAIRYIRDNCHHPIGVAEVLRAVPVARRSLDRRFKRRVGRTVHDEIQHARIRRARELLVRTSLSIPQVAYDCGFSGREYFSTVFTRLTGISPGAFRRQFRINSTDLSALRGAATAAAASSYLA